MQSSIAVAVAATLAAGPASDVRDRIQALYDGGEYEQALTLTINEYRASGGEGVFLYAGANAARALGDCPQATELYERALEKADSPSIKASIAAEIQACRERSVEEGTLPAGFVVRWGDAERALGRCEDATESYRRALRRRTTEDEATAARDGLEACKPPSPAVAVETTPPHSRPVPDALPRPDRLSPILFGTGGSLTILGAALIGGSVVDARRARAQDEQSYRDQTRRANMLLGAGVVVAGVGVGVLFAATVRRVVLRRRHSRR